MGMVWRSACLDAGQGCLMMLILLLGCGHTCSIHAHSGNSSVYNHWGCHSSPDKLMSFLDLAGIDEVDAGNN